MSSAKLSLKNMIFYGFHGVYPAEKELGQRIEVDLDMFADFERAGRADDLNSTVNYASVYNMVKEIVEKESYDLIEGIALAICDRVLGGFPLDRITVRVRKPRPPLGGLLDTVEFEITRGANEEK